MFILLDKHAGWAHKKGAAGIRENLINVQDARFSLWLRKCNFGRMTYQLHNYTEERIEPSAPGADKNRSGASFQGAINLSIPL